MNSRNFAIYFPVERIEVCRVWGFFGLKGQSNENFSLDFSLFEPAWATDQWVNIFSILVFHILGWKKLTCRGIIHRADWLAGVWYLPRGIMFWWIFYWLARVWYSMEIDSPGYHTQGRLTRWGMIHRADWLAGVWYSMEIDSPGYHTQRRLTRWGMIPRGDWLAGVSYPEEIVKFE